MMPPRDRTLARLPALAALALAAILWFAAPARAITLPPGFVAEDAVPGAGFTVPVSLVFLPDGRMMVGEKRGRVWMVEGGVRRPTPVWESTNEVLDEGDRGLIDVAVDPHFFSNHYVYFLYTVDPDSDGMDRGQDGFGRLVRYALGTADSNVVDPSTRTILMGTTWTDAPIDGSPSHTVDALRWGADGSLLVSMGDGAQYNTADAGGLDSAMFVPGRADSYQDIGAFRAQNLWSLNGKILRIDPATGNGYPSNPFWDGTPGSVRSRVWAYGLRNPYRFSVRPGTGSADPAAGDPGVLFIGDVGWDQWEEMNIARRGGLNFGWPCIEGPEAQPLYQAAHPAHGGCDSTGSTWNPAQPTAPVATWNHNDPDVSDPPGIQGNTVIGGAFYNGGFYPPGYQGRWFFGEYGMNWIKLAVADANDSLVAILPFADDADGPVCFATDPLTGDLYYVSIFTFEVRRVRYTGVGSGNTAPVAVAAGDPVAGLPPLAVDFSSAGTFDADADSVVTHWTFGDGQGSTEAGPTHVYSNFGLYTAILEAEDGRGGIGRDTVIVSVLAPTGFPVTPVLDDFNRDDGPIAGLWAGRIDGLVVEGGELVSDGSRATPIWRGALFGPYQEGHFRVRHVITNSQEYNLVLKAQGLSFNVAHLEVLWNARLNLLYVSTFDPSLGLRVRGGPWSLRLHDGDQLGARAHPDGRVEVFVNGTLVRTADCSGWPWAASSGRVGFALSGTIDGEIDDFGGGTVVINTQPVATIASPADSAFYAAGDTLRFVGRKSDAEDPPDSLAGHWTLHLMHNNHFHIESEADADSVEVVAEDHDDGTGVWYEGTWRVLDTGAFKSRAVVRVFPEADLEPGPVTILPETPTVGSTTTWSFALHNHGRLRAHRSRWALVAGGATIAEGDTVVAALDSVVIVRALPQALAAGFWDVRVVADTLGSVVETNESNNAVTQTLEIEPAPPEGGNPVALTVSKPFPNPTPGPLHLALELPREARVKFSVHDLQGRKVWKLGARDMPAGHVELEWSGLNSGGLPAPVGYYWAVVRVDGLVYKRPFVLVR